MDPDTSDQRVGESSSRKRRRKLHNRKSLAVSPVTPTRLTKGQKKRKREEEAGFWRVRRILDEKRERGRLFYHIDWEDNRETGESYPTSWEPRENVLDGAIREWARKQRREKKSRQKENKLQSPTESPAQKSTPDSQPIHLAKRQRLNLLGSPSSKQPRRVGTAESARFQSVSQEDQTGQGHQEEVHSVIKDSYEEELSNNSGRIRVVVPVNDDFDRDAYASYSIDSSQPSQPQQRSQPSQPSLPSQLSQPSQTSQPSQPSQPSRARFKTPRLRRYLWDEDLPSVIPDSQDFLSSSSYKPPTETPTSRAQTSTRPNTAEPDLGTPFHDTLSGVSHTLTDSSRIIHRRSEPPTCHSKSVLDKVAHCTSIRHKASSQGPLSDSIPDSTFIEATQASQLTNSTSSQTSETKAKSPSLGGRTATLNPTTSSQIPDSPERLPARGESAGAAEAPPSSIPQLGQASQSPTDVDRSLQFQTQLPFPHIYQEVSSQVVQNRVSDKPQRSHQHIHENQQSFQASTQRSVSSPEATWQAAQVVSPDIRPSIELSPAQHTVSALIEPNTIDWPLRSQTRTPPRRVSESRSPQEEPNHLPSQGHQDTVESIEPTDDRVSIQSKPSLPSSGLADIPSTCGSNLIPQLSSSAGADDMEDQPLTVREMLRNARAQAAAKTLAQQAEEKRAASAIPETPMTPMTPTIPTTPLPAASQMLPLRDAATDIPTVVDQVVDQSMSSPKSSPEIEPKSHGVQVIPFGPMEYAVPLPMVAAVRAIYETEIKNHKREINALNADEIDPNSLDVFNSIIDHIKKLCDHQSLVELDYATQENLSDENTTRFAENMSTKCQFIAGLLKELRSSNEHVAIVVRPGRMRSILEAMCRHYEVNYNRPDPPPSLGQSTQWPLQITFIPTTLNENEIHLAPTSLVIAFDSSFKRREYPELRVNGTNRNQLTPLVHLVVTHSIEHLELCIDQRYESLDRITALINGVVHLLPEMGKLNPDDYPEGEQAGKIVAAYAAARDPNSVWPMLQMPDIEGLEFNETPTSSEAKLTQPSGSTTQTYNTSSPAPSLQSGFKRPLSLEDDSESPKRQRLTPIPGEQSSRPDRDISRNSETVLPSFNGHASSNTIGAEPSAAKTPAVNDDQEDQVVALLKKVTLLEGQIRNKEATEVELRQFNQRLEARCEDYEKSIQNIQPKYQQALNDQGKFQHDISEAFVRENSMRQRHDARVAELTKIREDKALIDAELSTARISLSTSAIPQIAEFNKLKDELNALKTENDRLQKRITNMQSEIEYTRGHYQTASSAAASAAGEIDELKEENAALQIKASDNARRIHEIQASSEIKFHLERIDELETENTELRREVDKKTEELRAFLNGRRTTRGTSVPRSPRMGTMSPNVRERGTPIARVLGSGVGSRGNSPAPSEAPFRGMSTFGDALFPDRGGGRWGNHLV